MGLWALLRSEVCAWRISRCWDPDILVFWPKLPRVVFRSLGRGVLKRPHSDSYTDMLVQAMLHIIAA